jgi:zinc protease
MILRLLLCLLFCIPTAAFATPIIQEISAENGLKAWLIEDHALPIITVKMAFEGKGASSDPADKPGLAAFTMQMMDEGAGDMDSLSFHKMLENYAIHFSADTDEDRSSIGMQTLSEFKIQGFSALTLALTKPRFDEQAVERVRSSIINDLKSMEQNPDYITSRKWKEIAFAGTPYEHPKRGTSSSIAAIKSIDLKTVAANLYSGHITISIVGDITPEEVKKWLKTLPKTGIILTAALGPLENYTITLPDGNGTPVIVKNPIPQTVIQASLPAVTRKDPRYYALTILNHILGGNSLNSRLGTEIRNKRGLAYYADSSIEELDHASLIAIRFATRNEQVPAAIEIFTAELKKLSTDGITQTELQDAKNYLIGSFPLQIDNQNVLAEYLLAIQRYHLGKDYLEKRNGLINAITFAEVNTLAKKLLSHTPLVVMVGNPKDKVTP